MVLKANDRRTSCPCHDEFRGPRSDYVRQTDGTLHLLAEDVGLPELIYGTEKKRASNPRKNIALNTEKNAVFTTERYFYRC
ncbi:hypothetical protein TNCV_392421 [Trichonephila clavipes]|nr:hypothetical protein TNCV_392421 [Trichonephila clavipes]